tara:strand:+ start:1287 stop:1475 length:189 start_codon:yes stop_codon:yes gene_type:complete
MVDKTEVSTNSSADQLQVAAGQITGSIAQEAVRKEAQNAFANSFGKGTMAPGGVQGPKQQKM